MTNKIRVRAGDLIAVPFTEGCHTYARVLAEGSYAFYDFPSPIARNDYERIIQSDILFIARVDIFAVVVGAWTIISNVPLEDKLKNFYPRYFNPAQTNPDNRNFYERYRDEIENAIEKDWIKIDRIQMDGIYGRIRIERRLRDYYNGKVCVHNTVIMEHFKDYYRSTL